MIGWLLAMFGYGMDYGNVWIWDRLEDERQGYVGF